MNHITITFTLNEEVVEVFCPADTMLVDLLRRDLGMTGTKIGCREGECGACTVIMNGEAVNSCLVPAAKVMGAEIETIEGVADGDSLHPLQTAFIEKGSIQCGFCTPGMIMSAKALLDRNQSPDDAQIIESVGGNICRCTGYVKIKDAINQAAAEMRENSVRGKGE